MSHDCPLIAVIDDEDAVRTALRRLLQSAGHLPRRRHQSDLAKALTTGSYLPQRPMGIAFVCNGITITT